MPRQTWEHSCLDSKLFSLFRCEQPPNLIHFLLTLSKKYLKTTTNNVSNIDAPAPLAPDDTLAPFSEFLTPRLHPTVHHRRTLLLAVLLCIEIVPAASTARVVVRFADVVPVREEPAWLIKMTGPVSGGGQAGGLVEGLGLHCRAVLHSAESLAV